MMSINVIMPQLGESVVEGKVARWLKQEGDEVKRLEPVLEVETDKVTTEVTAEQGGTLLKIYVPEGETVKAGTLLAVIGEAGSTPPAAPAVGAVSAPAPHGAPAPAAVAAPPAAVAAPPAGKAAPAGKSAFVSPVVARIAAEHGVDPADVPGSGQGGRVTKQDILAYIARRKAGAPAAAPPAAPWETPGSGDLFRPTDDIYQRATAAQAPAGPAAAAAPAAGDQVVPHTSIRRAIAEHMVRSNLTSPHVTTVFEIDMQAVTRHLKANKDAFEREGVKLTYTAYLVAASVAALKANPAVNSSWSDEGLVLHRAINVGVAVSLGADGLIVPVLKNADHLSLLGLARAVNDLAARARARQLKPDDVQGGTFTITNHGVSGSLFATPIISQPQVAILGAGIIEKRVTVINDAIAIRPMCYISLTFDHRVLDGASGDAFVTHLKQTLEGWQ
jgi:2-oxoisovalerate dehydrogenase E2 component (dihydrolipoyl transacylase)